MYACPSMNLRIAKWGKGLAIRLPPDLVRRFGWREGDCVEARLTTDGALTIRPVGWSRQSCAAELEAAREALPMGRPVIDALRREARR